MKNRYQRSWLPSSLRCIYGRAMRHDPQPDDPNLETDIGVCEECNGAGCVDLECQICGSILHDTEDCPDIPMPDSLGG